MAKYQCKVDEARLSLRESSYESKVIKAVSERLSGKWRSRWLNCVRENEWVLKGQTMRAREIELEIERELEERSRVCICGMPKARGFSIRQVD